MIENQIYKIISEIATYINEIDTSFDGLRCEIVNTSELTRIIQEAIGRKSICYIEPNEFTTTQKIMNSNRNLIGDFNFTIYLVSMQANSLSENINLGYGFLEKINDKILGKGNELLGYGQIEHVRDTTAILPTSIQGQDDSMFLIEIEYKCRVKKHYE